MGRVGRSYGPWGRKPGGIKKQLRENNCFSWAALQKTNGCSTNKCGNHWSTHNSIPSPLLHPTPVFFSWTIYGAHFGNWVISSAVALHCLTSAWPSKNMGDIFCLVKALNYRDYIYPLFLDNVESRDPNNVNYMPRWDLSREWVLSPTISRSNVTKKDFLLSWAMKGHSVEFALNFLPDWRRVIHAN